jgi:hypothetical protein
MVNNYSSTGSLLKNLLKSPLNFFEEKLGPNKKKKSRMGVPIRDFA